jgi:hypothetical protein
MIKLQDFARQMAVTDRAIQKHLKNCEAELEGHFERKGPNGTWLDDYAQTFIRERMKQQPLAVLDEASSGLLEKNKELERERDDLKNKLLLAYEGLTAAKEQQLRLQGELTEQKLIAAKVDAAELALTDTRERAERAEDIAELNAQERDTERARAERAEAEVEQLRNELEAVRNRGFWARIFNK